MALPDRVKRLHCQPTPALMAAETDSGNPRIGIMDRIPRRARRSRAGPSQPPGGRFGRRRSCSPGRARSGARRRTPVRRSGSRAVRRGPGPGPLRSGPELDGRDDEGADADGETEGPEHEAIDAAGEFVEAPVHQVEAGGDRLELSVDGLEACLDGPETQVLLLLHDLEAIIRLLLHEIEALVHLFEDGFDQLPLMLQLLLDPDRPFTQLDLVDRGRFAQAPLGEPFAQVFLDELDVFGGQGHGRSLRIGSGASIAGGGCRWGVAPALPNLESTDEHR